MLTLNVPTTWYSMPGDNVSLLDTMLAEIADAEAVYMIAFLITNARLIRALTEIAPRVQIVHDVSQLDTYTRDRLRPLRRAGANITATSVYRASGRDEKCHEKSIVIDTGRSNVIYTGSLNFTAAAFNQTNQVARFESEDWVNLFVKRYNALELYGRSLVKQPRW